MIFKKKLKLKTVNPQTYENKELKQKVLDNVRDLFNELYYIYKDKYNKEKESLNTKRKKFFYYNKLRLTDDYQYESEDEEKKNNRLVKKNYLKSQQKRMRVILMNGLIKKETNINSEIFQRPFKLQRPSDMFKLLYKTNDKKKNKELVNMINSGLSDLENATENIDEEERKNSKTK